MTLTRNKPMSRGRLPERPARPDRSAEFASWTPRTVPAATAVMVSGLAERQPAPVPAKVQGRTDQRIRDSANGEDCHVRLPGLCNKRTDTTVWAHMPGLDGDRGMGLKALDLCGAYACCACHDAIDSRAPPPAGMFYTEVMLAFFHGHMRSLVTLARKGLV